MTAQELKASIGINKTDTVYPKDENQPYCRADLEHTS